MTKNEWKIIDDALSGYFGSVELEVDGHLVTFRKLLVTKNTMKIMTYVDGQFLGIWLHETGSYPEQKYLRTKSRYVYSQAHRADAKKYSKQALKSLGIDFDKKMEFLDPFWLSVSSIRRHYTKTFGSIRLTKINGAAHP